MSHRRRGQSRRLALSARCIELVGCLWSDAASSQAVKGRCLDRYAWSAVQL